MEKKINIWPENYDRKIGTIEPRYNVSKVFLSKDVCICDDDLAFIYGAIKKYGTDPKYLNDFRIYIKEIAEYIGRR
jgi:hypothetical protein